MNKVVISLSGGMDSATMLGMAKDAGYEVLAVNFTYGSKHNRWEKESALDLAFHYGVQLLAIDLSGAMQSLSSALLKSGGPIPEGHYNDASMSQTVVPGRNMVFISLLAGLCWSHFGEGGMVGVGIHQGDHAIYPDCREDFFKAMDLAVYLGTDHRVRLWAPLLRTDKAGIARIGLDLKVPYDMTRTCYKDQEFACGRCGSCNERLEAFRLAGANDPIRYEEGR